MLHRYRLLAALVALALPFGAAAQFRFNAAGLSAGAGVLTPHWSKTNVSLPGYRLTNHRLASEPLALQLGAYARFSAPDSWFFLQPEVGVTAGQSSYVFAQVDNPFGGGEYLYRDLTRGDLAVLAGARRGRFQALLGPAAGVNFVDRRYGAGLIDQGLATAIINMPSRLQLLGRAAAGVSFGRLDLRLSYELGLTPYAKRLFYRGWAYSLPLNNHLLLLSIGGRLYQRH